MLEHPTKNSKGIVLYSSGLDSTYNLFLSIDTFKDIKIIFFNYNQKSLIKEFERVKKVSSLLNVELITHNIDFLKDFNSSLVNKNINLPNYSDINDVNKGIKTEWLANRNGLFINIVATYSESLNYDYIVAGFNKEEAMQFPDNSSDFIKSINQSLFYSTLNKVKVHSYSINMFKKEIISKLDSILLEKNINPNIVWSCYNSYDKMCGKCSSCIRLKAAIIDSNLGDRWNELFLK